MDDEDIVREVAGQMLHKLGYGSSFSTNGDETLELYQKAIKSGTPFDAVILDLHVKEGMGGKEVMKKLLMIDINIKVIISSGYSNDPEMKNFDKYGFSGVLEKPYTIQDLSEVLDKVLLENKGKNSAK